MKPIKFKGVNVTFAENQPEYLQLPAHKSPTGEVISLWKLGWRERFKIFFTGKLWLRVETFNNNLQPQLPQVDSPLSWRKSFLGRIL